MLVDRNGLWPEWASKALAIAAIGTIAVVSVVAVVATAGAASVAVGAAATTYGTAAFGATAGATLGTVATYSTTAAAATTAAFITVSASSDMAEVVTGENYVCDTLFRGNRADYEFYKGLSYVAAAGITEVGSQNWYMSNGNAANYSKVHRTIHNDVIDKPRAGSALTIDEVAPIRNDHNCIVKEFPMTAQAHGFNDIVDNYAGYATKTQLSNATLYQLEGVYNGVSGRFEWIIQDGLVTHRMFVQNGSMNGVPIKP